MGASNKYVFIWGRHITRKTLKDVSNTYESVFSFIPSPPVNFHINRGDFLLKIRGGPWGDPRTGSMGWCMDPGLCFVYIRHKLA